MRTIRVLLAVLGLFPAVAAAQCSKDTDCKGDRICSAGACVDPTPPKAQPEVIAPPPPPPPAYLPPPQTELPRYATRPMLSRPRNWATGAGVVGLIGATAVMILTVPATIPDFTGTIFGGLAVLTAAIIGPIVVAGAASARFSSGVSGSPGLRVLGWVLYGLALATGAALVVLGITSTVPWPLVIGVGSMGVAGLVCFSIDAFVGAGQAAALADAPVTRRARPAIVPVLTALPDARGTLAPLAGLAGAF